MYVYDLIIYAQRGGRWYPRCSLFKPRCPNDCRREDCSLCHDVYLQMLPFCTELCCYTACLNIFKICSAFTLQKSPNIAQEVRRYFSKFQKCTTLRSLSSTLADLIWCQTMLGCFMCRCKILENNQVPPALHHKLLYKFSKYFFCFT